MSSTERDALVTAFETDWCTPGGATVTAFEVALAEQCATDDAVALTSAAAALHLGLRVLGVVRGDTVLMPTLAPMSSASAVRHVGAVPYFIDSEPHTGNIDPVLLAATVESLIGSGRKPAAVIAVDAFGLCADYDQIRDVCDRFDVPILEDASVALGATYRNLPAGSFGDLGVFSFNAGNLVTTGAGGALVGPAPYIERARELATQGFDDASIGDDLELGYSYRMSGLLAAVGSAQLARLDEMKLRCHEIHARYVDALSEVAGLHIYSQTGFSRSNGWMTVVGLNERSHPTPEEVRKALSVVHGIDVRSTWIPIHQRAMFADSEIAGGNVAARFHRNGLCLPSGSLLSESNQARVVDALRIAIGADTGPATVDLGAVRLEMHGGVRQNEANSAVSGQSGPQVIGG